jgi:hypothetical protein
MSAKIMARCSCVNFEFGTWTADVPEGADPGDYYETYTTECTQSTFRTFAMGHDAKLAGFLVRAEINGEEIRLAQGGVIRTFLGAVHAAQTISDAFAAKVAAQLAVGIAKAMKREAAANRKGKKADSPVEAPAPAPAPVTAKVGRWTYEGFIGPVTGDFVYEDKKGNTVAVPQGKFALVN